MPLKLKVGMIILAVFLVLGMANLCIQRFVMLPGFLTLERQEAIDDINRVTQSLENEIKHLDALVHDWASWDDTYRFVESREAAYVTANLTLETFEGLDVDLLYICDADGRVVYGRVFAPDTGGKMELEEFPDIVLPEDHPLIRGGAKGTSPTGAEVAGILMTHDGPLVVGSRPILKTDNTGPARGSLMMGYFLDDGVVKMLSEQIAVDLEIVPLDGAVAGEGASGRATYQIEERPKAEPLTISTLFPDISGEPALVIRAELPRKIMAKGYHTFTYSTLLFLVTVVTALSVMLLLLQRVILTPISNLTDHVVAAKEAVPGRTPLPVERRDEIGLLSREFAKMITQLGSRSRRLEELNATLVADIEKRKAVEEALRESEERFRMLLANLPVGVFVHDFDGRFLLVNDAACENTGYSREELLSKTLSDINPETVVDDEHRRLWETLQAGRSIVLEAKNIRKDGSAYPAEVHLTKIVMGGNPFVIALVFNITDRLKAEEALRASEEKLARSKKMESLGLLAGGVAHDLNNVLSGIVSYPELLLMDLPEGSKLVNPLKTIQDSGKRAVAIVQDLLTVARGVAVEKQVLNLNDVVEGYLASPEHDRLMHFHRELRVRTELDPKLFNIKGAGVHMGKTLMNLVSNAAEALGDRGEIVIGTGNCYLDSPLKGYVDVTIGEYAVLSVRDNGKGICQKDIGRIFEPFYTKKVMGRSGTGLGLAIVWNVVQEHRGYIDVVSGGTGTTFDLYFPISREVALKNDGQLSIGSYTGNGETVLVVDDVASQREIICSMLTKLGYRTASVPGGEGAVAYLKENRADLLVLDMIMDPGISGRETYERILKIRPGQKAVIVSGYAETRDVKITQEMGAGPYLRKPVQMEKLGLAVKAELSRRKP